MRAHRWSDNWGLHAILNKGEVVGLWDITGEEGNSRGADKTNVS